MSFLDTWKFYCLICGFVGWNSVVSILATGWTVRGSNPSRGEVFRTCLDLPWGPPSLLYNGHWVSFPGLKQPGCGIDHQSSSGAKVKERVELYLCSPSGLS